MSVDASMMTNLIQVTNLVNNKATTKDAVNSSQEPKFNQFLAKATEKNSEVIKNVENTEVMETVETLLEEVPEATKETLIQLLTSLLESSEVKVSEENEKLSALFELLLEGANKQREEQVKEEQNPTVDEAMSMLSMLMNMDTSTVTKETLTEMVRNVTLDSNSSLEVSMMQMEGRLNQLVTAMSEVKEEDSVSMLEMLMQANQVEQPTQKVEQTEQSTEQPIVSEENAKSMVTPVQTQPTQETKQVETPLIQVVENVENKEMQQETTSNNEMFANTSKEVEISKVEVAKDNTQELNDFEKAYSQMQAYRMNTTPTTVKEVIPTEVEEVIDVNKVDILNQISENMKTVNQIQDEYVIKLKPEGLGEIVVKLQSESNGKSVLSLIVNNENVKSILESDLNGLKAALSQTNVEVKEVVYDDNSQYFQQSNFMEGNSFYQEREENSTNPTFNYQFNGDEMEQANEEEILHDSIIHQHI